MKSEYIKKGFIMHLLPNCQEEYKRRHDEIWTDLVKILKLHGGRNYSIFLDVSSNQLFAYVEIQNEAKWNEVATTEICQKWWCYMKDLMETNSDNSPRVTTLKPVFYMK